MGSGLTQLIAYLKRGISRGERLEGLECDDMGEMDPVTVAMHLEAIEL